MRVQIAEFIREQAYRPLTIDELAQAMGIADKQQPQFRKALEEMEAAGEVVRTRFDRYGAPEKMNLAVGRLQGHPRGFAFLVPDRSGEADVFVGRESLGGAWHGDRVMARLSPAGRDGRMEGEIIRILQRANQRVVGSFEAAQNGGFVTPDDRRLTEDIFIPKGATNGAKGGEKVVAQIVQWSAPRRQAEGKVIERIGMKGQVGVDIVSVIRKLGLPEAFPKGILKEAEAVPQSVPEEAIREQGRRDLRGWQIVTIDGEDAKDLDDAVNVEKIGDGLWRLGVHIADVAYYVREGSAIDREALVRGTSVYLADRVVPMLPPALSNGICSLNPQVDRLTLSCIMEINGDGKVVKQDFFPSVIKTAARMSYTEVNAILQEKQKVAPAHEGLVPMFREMQSLMEVLRRKRVRRGAIDFDLPEAKILLNEEGWPVEIRRVERGISERMIEEFMLAANETVALHVARKELPFIYRVHGVPGPDKLAALRDFLQLFGYNLTLPKEGSITPKQLQGVTDWVRGRPEESLINSVLLRTMKQAVYSEANTGHFGLAADHYCHFTSPIRRYPDLMVHRVLRALFHGGPSAKQKEKWAKFVPEAAQLSSDRERVAVEAERETADLKKTEFMSDKVGEVFTGIISGVTTFGFFVQLPSTVEGLVHISSLTDDYYHFHERFYALIGERSRRRFRLGDTVAVKLMRADVETRQIDFVIEAAESPVVRVDQPAAKTRSRAGRKRTAAAPPPASKPAAPAPAPAAKPAPKPSATAPAPAPKPSATAPAPAAKPAAPTPPPASAAEPKAGAVDEAGRKTGRSRRRKKPAKATASAEVAATAAPKTAEEARPPVRASRIDMWGLPVPETRPFRDRVEVDPAVVNPFSVSTSRGDGGSRSRDDRKRAKETTAAVSTGSKGEAPKPARSRRRNSKPATPKDPS